MTGATSRPWTDVGSFSLREVLARDSSLIAQYEALARRVLYRRLAAPPLLPRRRACDGAGAQGGELAQLA